MMKRSLLLIVPVIALPVLWKSLAAPTFTPESSSVAKVNVETAAKFTCAMHPQIISDTPGTCPICGMTLVPVAGEEHGHEQSMPEDAGATSPKDEAGRKILYWYDPMSPGTKFDKPGKSPFMDMELVPKYADESDGDTSGGKPVVTISAENLQKMGARVEKATRAGTSQNVRATGIVAGNERARHDLYTQIEGRVTSLDFSAVGDVVKKGEPFYTLYSPELLTLQNDYIVALETGLTDVADAARRRMRLLGVGEEVLDTIATSRKASEEVSFTAPADGVLSRLEVRKGAYLMAGAMIGSIQDLSTIWLEAAVPEGDLSVIKEGAEATVTFGDDPTPRVAKVDYIYPEVTPETRTGKVRLVLDNEEGNLKPAGYATVRFAGEAASEALSVPSEAVLRTSEGEHVIVALGAGKFQAREVKTGAAGLERTEILEGLKEGEDVVTSAQFLIDSESSLRESLKKMSGGGHAGH